MKIIFGIEEKYIFLFVYAISFLYKENLNVQKVVLAG